MQNVFLELVKLSLIGSLFAVAVMLVRLIFRKAPKWIFVLLWGVVALRLVLPFSVESDLSLVPDRLATGQIITNVSDHYVGDVNIIYESNVGYSNALEAGRQPIQGEEGNYVVTQKDSLEAPKTVGDTVFPVLSWIWLVGVILMFAYTAVSYLMLKRKMLEATVLRDNIWQCEQAESPFVLGIVRPRIYLPYAITETDMGNVIAHEQAHIRRKDHWWKPIGFLLLSIHWFNPVMWIAYILLCRDIEAACDEKVIRNMDKDEMRAYSTALLNCSVHRRRIAACPLAFGEMGVKERIKRVMNYKKPTFWIIIASIVLCVLVAVCFLTNPAVSPNFAMNGNKVSDMNVDEIIDRIQRVEELDDGNVYVNSDNFHLRLDPDFNWVDSQTVRYFFYKDHVTYSAQLQMDPNSSQYRITESSKWREQKESFLLRNYLEAIKYLPQEAIRNIAPADHYILRQVEDGDPGQYDRVITYTSNGVAETDSWLIHLQIEPSQAAQEGYVGTGDEVVHLFYSNDEKEHNHTPVEQRQADLFSVRVEKAELTEYSICYEEPDGCITPVAVMGNYDQSFIIHNNLIYYVERSGGCRLCAIDFAGSVQKKYQLEETLNNGWLLYSDDQYIYGAAGLDPSTNAPYIFQADWNLTECKQIEAYPKQFRQFDYENVGKDFAELCQADISKIYVHGANVLFDANGMGYEMLIMVSAVSESETISGNLLLKWYNQLPAYNTWGMNPWFNKTEESYGSTEGLMTLDEFLSKLKNIEDSCAIPDNLPSGDKPYRLNYGIGIPDDLPVSQHAPSAYVDVAMGTAKVVQGPEVNKGYFYIVSKAEDTIIGKLYILI